MNSKSEVLTMLQAMGYNYLLVDKAYDRAPIKTGEGVINFINSNPTLRSEIEAELQTQEAMIYSQAQEQKTLERVQKESFEAEAYRKNPNVGFIDPVLREKLLLMGYEDFMVVAALQATNSASADAAVNWIVDYGYKIPRPAPVRQPQPTKPTYNTRKVVKPKPAAVKPKPKPRPQPRPKLVPQHRFQSTTQQYAANRRVPASNNISSKNSRRMDFSNQGRKIASNLNTGGTSNRAKFGSAGYQEFQNNGGDGVWKSKVSKGRVRIDGTTGKTNYNTGGVVGTRSRVNQPSGISSGNRAYNSNLNKPSAVSNPGGSKYQSRIPAQKPGSEIPKTVDTSNLMIKSKYGTSSNASGTQGNKYQSSVTGSRPRQANTNLMNSGMRTIQQPTIPSQPRPAVNTKTGGISSKISVKKPVKQEPTSKLQNSELKRREAMREQALARERQNALKAVKEAKEVDKDANKKQEDQEAARKEEEEKLIKRMQRIEMEKKKQDNQRFEVLKQIEMDKARRAGRDVKEVEAMFDQTLDQGVEGQIDEIVAKMEKIYPLRTPEEAKLKTCLKTCSIYLSKIKTIFSYLESNYLDLMSHSSLDYCLPIENLFF